MFEQLPDMLSVEQTMKALTIGKNSVYSLLKSNDLHHIKIGKKYLIPKICLIEFVMTHRQVNK